MRFMVDEWTGPGVGRWLREQGHQVFSVYDELRGASDEEILRKAFDGDWILITNDKDFGEKVYRERRYHKGVILLRLGDERTDSKVKVLKELLAEYSERLAGHFVVVTEHRVRFGRTDW